MADLDWNDLRHFLALYQAGSLARAARSLGVDRATVSRRLAALEARAGVRLFDRTPTGLQASPQAHRMAALATGAEERVHHFERELGGEDERLSGVVRVTTGELLGPLLLVPALHALQARWSEIRVAIGVHCQTLDLARREADIAVRLYRPRGDSLVVQRCGRHRVGVFGSSSYLRQHGVPHRVEDLAGHAWLNHDDSMAHVAEARWLREHVTAPRLIFETNSSRALLDACVAGLGLAVLPT